jgi:hypothetical protein
MALPSGDLLGNSGTAPVGITPFFLIEAVNISPPGFTEGQPRFADANTVVTVIFKNFGRTRADHVHFRFTFGVPDGEPVPEPPRIPTVLGPGDTFPMPFPRIGQCVNKTTFQQIMASEVPLRFAGEVTYKDVFGFEHWTRCGGTFCPNPVGFDVDENKAS